MSTIATRADEAPTPERLLHVPWLSGRIILLTLAFAALAQGLVYLPSVSRFVRSWTGDRVMAAQVVALALSSNGAEGGELDRQLLEAVRSAQAIAIRGDGTRWLTADGAAQPPLAVRVIDIREPTWMGPLRAALRALSADRASVVRLVAPGMGPIGQVEVVFEDTVFRTAVKHFTRDFFLVGSLISVITGVLLYLALHMVVVRPVRRLSGNIAAFAANPEDAERVIVPSGRRDEIGQAEEALARMEAVLAAELRQKRHLAELGLAVSKINHELRNMLTTAQLLGDRLGEVNDPAARRIAPRLIGTLARAIAFCEATLAYGRASEPSPVRRRLPVAPLVAELVDLNELPEGVGIRIVSEIPADLEVDADPEQLGRALLNLMRNAVEALSQTKVPDGVVTVSGRRTNGAVAIRMADNGPGVPDRIRARLFSAFQASQRAGGTGLGLPVAAELVGLHGGTIELEDTPTGASFLLTIPDRQNGGK